MRLPQTSETPLGGVAPLTLAPKKRSDADRTPLAPDNRDGSRATSEHLAQVRQSRG
jgi:hypothetical protein